MFKHFLLTWSLCGSAFAADFTATATEKATEIERTNSELAEWVYTMQPIRNRAGHLWFPGRVLSEPDAQAFIWKRLVQAKDDNATRVALAYALDGSTLPNWDYIRAQEDPKLRGALLHLTKKSANPTAPVLLTHALGDESGLVREEAARLAGYLPDAGSIEKPLIDGLQDLQPSVRALAARSLSWINCSAAYNNIRVLLQDHDAQVRYRALQALITLDSAQTKALPELHVLQGDSHPPLARKAARLLE